ncbi:helix-turn-helix domain-containing protein, partial [Microbacterium sufflavum]|uniref:helix-turn-helix domain-containing protein n=1 Tax=Microbacterium sufflavum TaxID=2851649 RepID=UPI001FFD6505
MSIASIEERRRRPQFGLQHRMALAREVAGIGQAKMAQDLGVSRQTVSNYERGFTAPRRAVLLAWAMATGVDVEWLESGDAPRNPVGPAGIEPTTSTV